MFETFCLSYEARIYIERSDRVDWDHRTPAAVVGRAWSGTSGAAGPEPLLLHGGPGRGHGDLRIARQGFLAAAYPQDHALPAARVRQAAGGDGFGRFGIPPAHR